MLADDRARGVSASTPAIPPDGPLITVALPMAGEAASMPVVMLRDPENLKRKTDDGGWLAWFVALFSDSDRSHDGSAGVELTTGGPDHGADSSAGGDSGGDDGGGGDGGGD